MAQDFMAEVLGISRIGIRSERLNAVANLPAKQRSELITEMIRTDGFYALLATLVRSPESQKLLNALIGVVDTATRLAEREKSASGRLAEIKNKVLSRLFRRHGLHNPEIQAGADVSGDEGEMKRLFIEELRRDVELEAKRLEGQSEQIDVDRERAKDEAIG